HAREHGLEDGAEAFVFSGEIFGALTEAVGVLAPRASEDGEGALGERTLLADDPPEPGEVRADDHVGVVAAKGEDVVTGAGVAPLLDDACGLEPAEVRKDVALRATELEGEIIHRSRIVR